MKYYIKLKIEQINNSINCIENQLKLTDGVVVKVALEVVAELKKEVEELEKLVKEDKTAPEVQVQEQPRSFVPEDSNGRYPNSINCSND